MELENKNIEIKGKGIKVHFLSSIFIALGVIIMIASFFVIKKIYDKYDEMGASYRSVEVEREAAVSFKTASDYLTEQTIKYAATGEKEYADNYFQEKNQLKNREGAIEVISNCNGLKLEGELLNDAMQQSEALVEYELHAMKLVAAANGTADSDIADEIASYKLTDDEVAMSSDEQRELAIELLYSKDYENLKDRINWDIENATVLIEEESGARYRENEDSLIITLNMASLLIFIMFILLVLIFIFNALLVVRPADKFLVALNNKEKLPEIGGYEFRKFARMYNNIYRSDKKNKALLKEQGEIDELTGTLKAGTLELVKHNLTQTGEALGIVLVDIDNFRSIKEANGYEVADKVVEKVAKQFTSTFKSSDYIVRLSQDEFELFLLRMGANDSSMLAERINKINDKLRDTNDGIPAVSVSVGVAFSENGYTDEVERKADMALNSVKENGRGACKIAD